MDVRYIGFPPQSDFLKFTENVNSELKQRFNRKKWVRHFSWREPIKAVVNGFIFIKIKLQNQHNE